MTALAAAADEPEGLPPPAELGPVAAFDAWVDERLEPLRHNRVAEAVFTTASTLGDWSLIWHLTGAARAVGSSRRARQSVVLAAMLGAESLLVNQGLKRLFRRTRPTVSGDPRFEVRTPSTSSFPSGHASAAMFAATILTAYSGKKMAPVWFGMGAVVATSRVYVRIHHASDIIGGAAVGLALGRALGPLARRV